MANLAMAYMGQGRRKEAKELQTKAVNQLRATLGDDHPSTVSAIANLALFREVRTAPPFRGPNDLMERLRDRILQFAASWPFSQGKDSQERLESSSTVVGSGNGEFGSFQATSVKPDEGSETDEERLQRALAMSMMDENDSDEIDSFQATSIEPDEGNETDEERLQRALAMSMVDENDYEESVASKENIRLL